MPNVMVITIVKLLKFAWVNEFDNLGLVGFLAKLAPHGVEHHLSKLSENRVFGNLGRVRVNPFLGLVGC